MTETTINSSGYQSGKQSVNVLLVDNDSQSIRTLLEMLARKGVRADLADNRKTAVNFLDKENYSLVFLDVKMSEYQYQSGKKSDNFEFLKEIRAGFPQLPVIMMADFEKQTARNTRRTIDTAIKAIRYGCCDFLTRPLDAKKVQSLLDTFLPNHDVEICYSGKHEGNGSCVIIGKSAKLLQTVNLARKIAPTSVPVLVSGESGTGKELFSWLIHHNSKRVDGPYVKVNCAALSDSLLESELFGHEKGAFTGAYMLRKGRFEMAHGGTLLLDEITETPLKFQAKLLRVLEQQDFERVGGNDNVRVDVRIISTTNKELSHEVAEGRFREDLYFRLSGIRLIVPPLRQRSEDLPELVWHFVNLYAPESQRRIRALDTAMMDILSRYNWPGNIRQLRNVVLTSLILGSGDMLALADVSWLFDELQPLAQEKSLSIQTGRAGESSGSGLGGLRLEKVERRAILDTLEHTSGNQTKAAKILGISDRTLRDKIRRYRSEGRLQTV